MNLINRGGYLHEKYRVPRQLIEELLANAVSAAADGHVRAAAVDRPAAAAGAAAARRAAAQNELSVCDADDTTKRSAH